MNVFNVDYRVAEGVAPVIVKLVGYNSEDDAGKAELAEGAVRLQVRAVGDLNSLAEPVLAALWAFKAPKGVGMPEDVTQAIWNLLVPPPKDSSEPTPPAAKKRVRKPKAKKELPASDASAKEGSPDGAPPSDQTQEKTMAKGKAKAKGKTKKAAKKKVAAKKTATRKVPGMPREGTKKDKLLKAAQKSGGITKAEGVKLTGWKEFRGTLGELAKAAKMKVVIHKDKDGKKATRWEVK
jgi:hypothetical protein